MDMDVLMRAVRAIVASLMNCLVVLIKAVQPLVSQGGSE